MENVKIEKSICDIFGDFQTLCDLRRKVPCGIYGAAGIESKTQMNSRESQSNEKRDQTRRHFHVAFVSHRQNDNEKQSCPQKLIEKKRHRRRQRIAHFFSFRIVSPTVGVRGPDARTTWNHVFIDLTEINFNLGAKIQSRHLFEFWRQISAVKSELSFLARKFKTVFTLFSAQGR